MKKKARAEEPSKKREEENGREQRWSERSTWESVRDQKQVRAKE